VQVPKLLVPEAVALVPKALVQVPKLLVPKLLVPKAVARVPKALVQDEWVRVQVQDERAQAQEAQQP
jgi:hypothetical protein